MEIYKRNVNEALPLFMEAVTERNFRSPSRVGETIEYPEPVTTIYTHPQERVCFVEQRDANPFFHLMEALWMLAGRKDAEFVCHYNKRMIDYSNNGEDFHAAYGHRWRQHFGFDQIETVVTILKEDKMSRRAVVAMWSPDDDLGQIGNDFPCNMIVSFSARKGELDMHVHNRSNDALWGCYGANVVHMSMLQEYIAGKVGIPLGKYYQFSMNLHCYTESDVFQRCKGLKFTDGLRANLYDGSFVRVVPMMKGGDFDEDLDNLMMMGKTDHCHTPFFKQVVAPLYDAWEIKKAEGNEVALRWLELNSDDGIDWVLAAKQWLQRRVK